MGFQGVWYLLKVHTKCGCVHMYNFWRGFRIFIIFSNHFKWPQQLRATALCHAFSPPNKADCGSQNTATTAKLLYGNSFSLPLNSPPPEAPSFLVQIQTLLSELARRSHTQMCQFLPFISLTSMLCLTGMTWWLKGPRQGEKQGGKITGLEN